MTDVSVRNARGEWVPAIPLPLFLAFHRRRCFYRPPSDPIDVEARDELRGMLVTENTEPTPCPATFWTDAGYRGHYAYAHILGMGST